MFAPGGGVGHLRWALLRHVLALLLVMAVVSLLLVWQGDRVATKDARIATEMQVRTIGLELSAPLRSRDLDEDEWRHDLDAALLPRVESGELLQVKVWAPEGNDSGRIIWSTRAEEIDTVRVLDSELLLFGTDGSEVHEVTTDSYPDRDLPPELFEAYVGFADQGGNGYLLEVYKPVADPARIRNALLRDWLPLALGGVLLLGLATLPLSLSLSRRVAAVERERRAIAQQALNAAAAEHQRMAEQIHDRALQDLAGAALMLGTLRRHPLPAPTRAVVDQVEAIVGDDIALLRDLLDGPYAPPRGDQPLAAAITDWCDELGIDGVRIEVAESVASGRPEVEVAHRIIKEALRNVARHAPGATVRVEVHDLASEVTALVVDDGPGFDPDAVPDGHFGLRLMALAAQSRGGSVTVETAPGEGTAIRVVLPRDPGSRRGRWGVVRRVSRPGDPATPPH
ncbi:ATP-binding protein [Nocardioides sp. AE5]|uniref:sensor histidine kinase n=1 Tax=Nocardioides sp. AE5 TaxID=2962573 RepID=UPI002881F2BF|nr:ATP-binding protein [Nocardioides sp. AE5]MDT0200321.1 ATP-binding protein [Nocardioides sp. AE5]